MTFVFLAAILIPRTHPSFDHATGKRDERALTRSEVGENHGAERNRNSSTGRAAALNEEER